MEISYDNVLRYSNQIASRFIKDRNVTEEIAQLAAIQYFLNKEKINKEKTDNWLFTVTKNFCLKRIKQAKENHEILL
jgi:DNA-directed RNA polymerase specialized sigma24 family protein